ncbi:hypothetical protein KY284_000469 [Solanum tuberosum]|nr:hypothetical protein KY284_000469 [Solanum tuberosum]
MWLRTQKQIAYVDISDCGIQGEVPTWFWNLSSQIGFLNLSHNQFVGEVPIISIDHEQSGSPLMYLASNNFSGPIPLISTNVRELDLSNNSFSKGLSNFLCEAKNGSYKLRILNLGGNDLSEEIPDCWMNWPELKVLILRDNNLIGSLPRYMEVLSNLLSLDLRRNRLNGPFPSSLESCSKLHKIDLTVRIIPLSTQLQSFDPTSFQGNKLCGLPLLVNCSSDGNIPNHKYEDDESDKDEVDWFYISMAIGFALSFWGVCGSLLFKRSWRHAYFRFLDRSWEMLLAKIPIW